MRRMAVVVFPGSNCDADTLDAARAAGADAYYVWHRETDLKQPDIVLLPGGFSYGDYLRSGAIARFSPIMDAVTAHARADGPVLGICNGFQILCEAGLLPGALMRNARLRFLSRPVRVRVEATDLRAHLYRHGEGWCSRSPMAMGATWRTSAPPRAREAENRVVWRYVGANPNGSTRAIAGVAARAARSSGSCRIPSAASRRSSVARTALGFLSLEAAHATQHAGDVRAVGGHDLGLC
jgi:phosphoribosylformylglycinamidine synthase